MIEKLLSPLSKEVWVLLNHPENWMYVDSVYSRSAGGKYYHIIHKDTKVCLWICNGRWFLDGYSISLDGVWTGGSSQSNRLFDAVAPKIGLFDRHILWFRVKNIMKYLDNMILQEPGSILNDLKEYNKRNA